MLHAIYFFTFSVNTTPNWRLGDLASREATIDFTALRISHEPSRDYELSVGASLANVDRDCSNNFCVKEK